MEQIPLDQNQRNNKRKEIHHQPKPAEEWEKEKCRENHGDLPFVAKRNRVRRTLPAAKLNYDPTTIRWYAVHSGFVPPPYPRESAKISGQEVTLPPHRPLPRQHRL